MLARNFGDGRPTRVSGARTGLAGGSVAGREESVLSVEALKSISEPRFSGTVGAMTVRVGAGVTLAELTTSLAESTPEWFFPVDPTETAAALGGMASTNASGARSYFYGAMRNWVHSAKIVLSDGSIIELERGRDRIEDGRVSFAWRGEERCLSAAPILKPMTKNTIGYCWSDRGDVLDVFIGAEGTLGVFTELELRLAKRPSRRLSYIQFFPTDDAALSFVSALRELKAHHILAIEYFDRRSLELACESPRGRAAAPAKLVGPESRAAVYIEAVCDDEAELERIYASLGAVLEALDASEDASFAGLDEKDIRELKVFRHAVPERIHALIVEFQRSAPGIHKIATDMAVPSTHMRDIYQLYRSTLEQAALDFAVFGHVGDSHFHVNIIPRNEEELKRGKALYEQFARRVVELGGSVAAEHGIGRLKRSFLEMQYSPTELQNMRMIKKFFDEAHLLNRGVLFFDAE